MDWLTLTVEIVGGVIVCTWAVVPVREFREIYRSLKRKGRVGEPAEGAFPVVVGQDAEGNGEDVGEGRE